MSDLIAYYLTYRAVIFVVTFTIYFLPSFIGGRKRNGCAIFVLNLFLGWTIIGWVIALVWACCRDENTRVYKRDENITVYKSGSKYWMIVPLFIIALLCLLYSCAEDNNTEPAPPVPEDEVMTDEERYHLQEEIHKIIFEDQTYGQIRH